MGLKDKLSIQGSKFTYTAEGSFPQSYPVDYVPPINPLATIDSDLHGYRTIEGYSTKGTEMKDYPQFFQNYMLYKTENHFLPVPSSLEPTSLPQYIDRKFK